MEESTEAHMETDVSSTTGTLHPPLGNILGSHKKSEDVPEAQEVTGSNGNVEMVVFVEKISDDESTSSSMDQGCKQSTINSEMPVDSNPEVPLVSPQKTAPVPKSPAKDNETQKSPLDQEHSYNKAPLEQNTEAASPSILQSDDASSCKFDVQKSPKKYTVPKKHSPVKDSQDHKSPQAQKSPQTTPTKEQAQETKKLSPNNNVTPEKPVVNGKVEKTCNEKDESNSSQSVPIEIVMDKEASDDSQMETNSDVSEKEHNKSISRELKSLIKSAKESKIISECTQLTTKTRKSRAPLDASNSSLNVSLDADKIQDVRRSSTNSQKSNCSEMSEKVPVKRSMRSQNPEFVNKVKQFLNSVTSKVQKESDDGTDDDSEETKVKDPKTEPSPVLPKKKKGAENVDQGPNKKLKTDPYCWRCHWTVEQTTKAHAPLVCTVCPRAFHYKCLTTVERSKISAEKSWVCPECMTILHAESSETRSPALKKISLVTLCDLLKHAVQRMMDLNGVEPFMHPVDRSIFPDYDKYVVHPMDLSLMKTNIDNGVYGSTEAFQADVQWILHNSIIFNTLQSKLTGAARTLMRSCRAEMGEIEACPECYAAAHARKPTWFTDVCTTPHILLWAKLKGFPYWPAKGMSVNNAGLVDVRFFGAHDRAWVPAKDCFLYSEKDPNNFRNKRQDILDSMQEAEQHIRNISRKYGKFVYPPFKTQFDPSKLTEQLKIMIPSFEGEVRGLVKEKQVAASPSLVKDKRSSKSSKSSFNDGDASEGEDAFNVSSRKMADGAHIARIEDDASDKDKSMDVDVGGKDEKGKPPEKTSRKRRRSEMEEAALITIMDNKPKEKKKKVDDKAVSESEKKADTKNESQATASSSKEEQKTTPKEGVAKANEKTEIPIAKSKEEPTNSTPDKEKTTPKLTPIRLVISANQKRVVAKTTGRGSPKVLPIKIKQTKLDKSVIITKVKTNKDEKVKQKRRNSKSNKSLNSSTVSTPDKTVTKTEKTAEVDKIKDKDKKENATNKSKEDANKSVAEKANTSKTGTDSPKSKDRIQFDDDTSLAEIARGANKAPVTDSNLFGLPTISSVRSLSTTAQKTNTTTTKNTTSAKTIEVTIEPTASNSLLTPTTVTVVKETAKPSEPSLVGRVGVRAFARMASPELQKNKEVEVEIKAEPIDFDDSDRQMEKLDMMKAFRLRPVNQTGQPQPATNLREVRINKVVMTPLNARKTAAKPVEARPRARKTFPQPKKPEDGRSELNSKNSMVYIPIQPPMTPGPMRARATVGAANGPVSGAPGPRMTAPIICTATNNIVNTVTTPLSAGSAPPLSLAGAPASLASSPAAAPGLPLLQVGQVPATVHRVPLITSVNGQWTFSLQPIMSVGGLDDSSTPPLLNGLPERTNSMTVTPLSSGPPLPAVVSGSVVAGPAVASVPGPGAPNSAALTSLAPTSTASPGAKTTDCPVNPGEPPRLQQRPLMNPFDSQTPIGSVPPPSSVGPVTAKLNQNAVKLTDFFRTLLEDSLEKLDDPSTQLTTLRLKSEQMNWKHQQEIEELKHNHELILAEMRTSFEKEKSRLTAELRRTAQTELEAAVKQAKGKQWCANCYQEAQFYCCWNTSYCDYPCQRAHWAQHYAVCTQQRPGDAANNPNDAPGSRLQPQPDNIPKCTTASATTPALTVGGKVAQPRQDPPAQNKSSSIIMSMVEDKSGNQTMKCVGVYKPPAPVPNQVTPIVINNQVMNTDNNDNSNKVVTSGGYLIVGGSSSNQVTTPPRRTRTIQYFT